MARVLFLEAYDGGSHRRFARGWIEGSRHEMRLLGLPARKWKWRMQAAAWIFAEQLDALDFQPDLVFATDMVDLAQFLGLARRRLGALPAILYFHENQYSYPPQAEGRDDYHWGTINSASALAADRLLFNSDFHRRDFFRAWRRGNRRMPDARLPLERIEALEADALVLPVGIDFDFLDSLRPQAREPGPPRILWNHRWEHDKGPEEFFDVMQELQGEGLDFELLVCGEAFADRPDCFEPARRTLAPRLRHWGYLPGRETYARLLWQADLQVSTARQEFLGLATLEALWCGCHPLLPRRLSYPELLPPEQHEAHLYSNASDLKRRLRRLLTAPAPPAYAPRQDYLAAYAWPLLRERLDGLVDQCLGIANG